jgi:hypothetical protein
MPRFVGTLNIIGNDSNLSGTALVRVTGIGDPFDNATTFLTQDRHLQNMERIFVDGNTTSIGSQSAINITNAGRELPAVVGAGGVLKALSDAKKGRASAGKGGGKKGGAKKSGGKKSAKKSSKKGGGK